MIESGATGRCIDVEWGNHHNGELIGNHGCHGADNQLFKTHRYGYTNVSEPIYRIQAKHSGKVLDVPNNCDENENPEGCPKAGVPLIQWQYHYENLTHLTPTYDRFSVMSYENGGLRTSSYILRANDIAGARVAYGNSGAAVIKDSVVNKESSMCLSNSSSSTFTQQLCNKNLAPQAWRIIYLDETQFRIVRLDTNQCISVVNHELRMTNCAGESGNGNASERFRFMDNNLEGSSWSRIQSVSTNDCLDLYGGGSVAGTQIGLWSCHDGDNQKFAVNPVQSGAKICEFNDPVSGTTTGCTSSSVGGGGTSVARSLYKNGNFLVTVVTNTANCTVSISGTSANYSVSGNCNNYRVYQK